MYNNDLKYDLIHDKVSDLSLDLTNSIVCNFLWLVVYLTASSTKLKKQHIYLIY